jgi:hypothetical protein
MMYRKYVPSKSNKQKNLKRSLTKIAGSGSISQRYGSADPDPKHGIQWVRAHLITGNMVGEEHLVGE